MKKMALLAFLAAGTLSAQPLTLTPEQKALAAAGNDFSFRFLQQVEQAGKGDWFVSPASLQFLLGVILNGAQAATADEIAATLGIQADRLDALNDYNRLLLERFPKLDPQTKLRIGNAVFVNQEFPINKDFQKLTEKYYGAEVKNLDFRNGNASLRAINGWCSKQTEGLIPAVLEKVEPSMFAYLLNALYFKGSWEHQFSKSSTRERTFRMASGEETQVQMMQQERKFAYGEDALFRCLRLPYGNGSYAMYLLLPQEGRTIAEVLASLDAASWETVSEQMYASSKVNLWLPTFETRYHIRLNDILCTLGMPGAFKEGADLKKMSALADCLDFVQQDAVIKVDEKGSEAAAVTSAGVIGATAVMPTRIIQFHCDRPFIYLITETATGSILFAGEFTGE